MIALADRLYAALLEGLVLLGANPVACSAIGFLRTTAIWLLALAAIHAAAQAAFVLILRRRSQPWKDAREQRIFEACRSRSRVRHAALRRAPAGFAPAFTAGVARPAIYLDPSLANQLDDREVEAVLLHELAHVERHDGLVARAGGVALTIVIPLVLQAFVVAAFFTSGTMHFGFRNALALTAVSLLLLWIVRRPLSGPLRRHAELCCDERAVVLGADAPALASAIVSAARLRREAFRRRFGPALLPCAGSIDERVRHLLDPGGSSRLAIDRLLRAAALGLLLLAALYVHDFHARMNATGQRARVTSAAPAA